MKTAISLPDPLFKAAEALARRLGVSRSQLFANAIAELIAQHDRSQLTERLNAVYGESAGEPPDLGLAALQARSLPSEKW
jgi:metal-responsive CopG/Arc/MetJ family transcriptional regulator